MPYVASEHTMKYAKAHALAEYPRESCGLVLLSGTSEIYLPMSNRSDEPTQKFKISPEDFMDAEDSGTVLAVIHSHPDASSCPSQPDRVRCEATELPWAVIGVTGGPVDAPAVSGVSWIYPCGYTLPLIGRDFHHGMQDCFTLIRDYYQRALNVTLPDFEREDKWWEKGQNLYVEQYEQAGFVTVSSHEIRKHDIILMQVRSKVPNHGAVYLGDGKILHHMYGRLSMRVMYGGIWADMTTHVLRYTGDVTETPDDSYLR